MPEVLHKQMGKITQSEILKRLYLLPGNTSWYQPIREDNIDDEKKFLL
jgi:hypothetical protein